MFRIPYLSVQEVIARSREWHSIRKAMSGQSSSPSTLASTSANSISKDDNDTSDWNGGYMRKQFPPSWFLSGKLEGVVYNSDSPIPLSYHGDTEVLSHLPTILRPRYPPLPQTESKTKGKPTMGRKSSFIRHQNSSKTYAQNSQTSSAQLPEMT